MVDMWLTVSIVVFGYVIAYIIGRCDGYRAGLQEKMDLGLNTPRQKNEPKLFTTASWEADYETGKPYRVPDNISLEEMPRPRKSPEGDE